MSKRATRTSASAVKKPPAKKPVGFGAPPALPKTARAAEVTAGEDLGTLKKIAKEVQNQSINVEDYILLIGPHTGDKGAALTKVMNEDLTAFRKMVIKVYDTMTKDASDVMANTQLELGELYAEKHRLLVDNMIRSLQTIKDYVPDFDFQQYFTDPDKYLGHLFKLADIPDEEEIEIARRQLAYHRLQWLQSEGERLQAENVKLEERLNSLKKIKRKQIEESLQKEEEAEKKRKKLEKKQEKMQIELEGLCDELHETIITEEKKTINAEKEKKVKLLAKKKGAKGKGAADARDKEPWNVKTAREYSKAQIQGEASANLADSIASSSTIKSTRGGAKTKSRSEAASTSATTSETTVPRKSAVKKKKAKKPVPIHARPAWQDVNPTEFDTEISAGAFEEQVPIDILRVGTSRAARSSPIVRRETQTAAPAAPCAPTCSGTTRQRRAPPPGPSAPAGRRARAPQDSWRGFS